MRTNGVARFWHPHEEGGTTDPDSGIFTPDPEVPPYASVRAFLFDEGAAMQWNGNGAPTLVSDAQLFLPKGTVEREHVEERDRVVFRYDNADEVDAEVMRATRATSIVQLRRV